MFAILSTRIRSNKTQSQHIRLEARYARERGRLTLQLLHQQQPQQPSTKGQQHAHAHADALDALAEALALFQEVEATQAAATVEEIDQVRWSEQS
jgi:hypothetical protein